MGEEKRNLAVGLRYTLEDEAPLLTAKGEGRVAEWILEEAKKLGIPTVKDPSLVNALFATGVDVGEKIPPEVYRLVAQLLAYIYSKDKS